MCFAKWMVLDGKGSAFGGTASFGVGYVIGGAGAQNAMCSDKIATTKF